MHDDRGGGQNRDVISVDTDVGTNPVDEFDEDTYIFEELCLSL